jgi:hypothetical protein
MVNIEHLMIVLFICFNFNKNKDFKMKTIILKNDLIYLDAQYLCDILGLNFGIEFAGNGNCFHVRTYKKFKKL